MRLEHIALAFNSEELSDKFFIHLLGLTKTRSFSVSPDLTKSFFGIQRETSVIRYSSEWLDVEVFIADNQAGAQDRFTHVCLEVDNQTELANRARSMGLDVIQVPKKSGESYYIFIKDFFGNSYEIKDS